jgi:hypothetical protein
VAAVVVVEIHLHLKMELLELLGRLVVVLAAVGVKIVETQELVELEALLAAIQVEMELLVLFMVAAAVVVPVNLDMLEIIQQKQDVVVMDYQAE